MPLIPLSTQHLSLSTRDRPPKQGEEKKTPLFTDIVLLVMIRLNGGFAMTFATSSPGASTAGQGTTPVKFLLVFLTRFLLLTRDCFPIFLSRNMLMRIQQPICQNCTTSTTPLWRRDESGSVLCNACGLFLKLHGRPRPISLKTDVIKSRNRVKNSGQPAKKKVSFIFLSYLIFLSNVSAQSLFDSPNGSANGHSVARSENGTPPPGHRKLSSGATPNRSVSPQSRAGTPLPPTSHIAPPSIFESLVNHADHSAVGSPSPLPGLNSFNHPSPGSTSSLHDRHLEQPTPTLDSLMSANSKLKTRVAELELVNDLFRSRVSELEQSETNARQKEITRREVEAQLRQFLSDSAKREEELKRKLDETERELGELRGDHQRKKVRVSDLTE